MPAGVWHVAVWSLPSSRVAALLLVKQSINDSHAGVVITPTTSLGVDVRKQTNSDVPTYEYTVYTSALQTSLRNRKPAADAGTRLAGSMVRNVPAQSTLDCRCSS